MSDEMICLSKLRERGWSPSMIKNILGEPDKLSKNPHYRSGAPVRLYLVSRIEQQESTEGFSLIKEKAAKRAAKASISATESAQRQRNVLLASITEMEVEVIVMDVNQAQKNAIISYNENNYHHEQYADEKSDDAFLRRITVNYIRHELTEYDGELSATAGRVGVYQAVPLIQQKVFSSIAAVYPHLRGECRTQLQKRTGYDLLPVLHIKRIAATEEEYESATILCGIQVSS